MATLSTAELTEIRQLLEAERDRILAQLGAGDDQLVGRNPDRADLATAYAEREQRTALSAIHEENLAHIEAALGRLNQGTYGFCEECGQPIDVARLRVLPSATKCIECQRSS